MMKRDVPVYLITGFLESGKTQFLDFTIHQSYFQIPDKTLLILCEEGEEEYGVVEKMAEEEGLVWGKSCKRLY